MQTSRSFLEWGAGEVQSALWAICILQEHRGLSGGQSYLSAFRTTVQTHAVTVLQKH